MTMTVKVAVTAAAASVSAAAVLAYSRFVARRVAAQPELNDELAFADLLGWDRAAMDRFLAGERLIDGDGVAIALRRLRDRVLVRLAARDLAGLASLAEVHQTMSDLAECCAGNPRSAGVNSAATVTAELGSISSLARSHIKRIACTISSSRTVTTAST